MSRRPLRGGRQPVRVLVVDDEPTLSELLAMALRYEGWEVRTAARRLVARSVRRASSGPTPSSSTSCCPTSTASRCCAGCAARPPRCRCCSSPRRTPSRTGSPGLTAGGDDYVTKPFSIEELVARLRGLLRRAGMAAARQDSALVVGDLVLDEDSHEVRRGDTPVELTATEFELLRFLMRNPKRVLSKAQILDRVWHYDFGGQSNVVELYISYLRKKIDAGRAPMIHTVRGRGLRAQTRCGMRRPREDARPGRTRCVRAWSRPSWCCSR